MPKTVYQTDDDGMFLYEAVANELPMSPGAFNVPYGAYPDAPPAGAGGRWPRWTGNGWQMVEDHRATPLWVAATGASYSLGDELDVAGETVSYPGWGDLPAWLTDVQPTKKIRSITK